MKTLNDLLASLALSNNGYLWAPSPAELAIARQNPDVVDIRNGQIHRRGVQPCHPAQPKRLDYSLFQPQPDYEGAILARQEADQRYW